MLNMNYYMPVRLITGRGCVGQNASVLCSLGKKALLVTGKNSAKACGALADVCAALDSGKVGYSLYDKIEPNPSLLSCDEAAAAAVREGCDFVIGIGGGSPLDAAKCIAVLAANPGMTQAQLYSLDWPVKPLPVVCVGTTAGTGSEVTKVSVITLPEGRKKSFHHEDIYPAVSFGDPAYTDSLPKDVTCSTAIDALAHALESYFSRYANDLSQSCAVRAVRLLLPRLEKLGRDIPLTQDDRDAVYFASLYAGLAINQTSTCLPHTMGYFMTERFGLPHGYACAVFLPDFLRITEESMPQLARSLYNAAGTSREHLNGVIIPLLSGIVPEVSEEDIALAHDRWINNASIKKGYGDTTPEECDDILRNLFKLF